MKIRKKRSYAEDETFGTSFELVPDQVGQAIWHRKLDLGSLKFPCFKACAFLWPKAPSKEGF
jgi:hypothetical protein